MLKFNKHVKLIKIDLLKIDTEPHGAKNFNRLIGGRMEGINQGLGYLYFNINEKRGMTSKVNNLGKSEFYNYLLCSKETAEYLQLNK